jgi:hypothetical protein
MIVDPLYDHLYIFYWEDNFRQPQPSPDPEGQPALRDGLSANKTFTISASPLHRSPSPTFLRNTTSGSEFVSERHQQKHFSLHEFLLYYSLAAKGVPVLPTQLHFRSPPAAANHQLGGFPQAVRTSGGTRQGLAAPRHRPIFP